MLMGRAQNYVLHKVYCDLDEWGPGRRGEYRVGLEPNRRAELPQNVVPDLIRHLQQV